MLDDTTAKLIGVLICVLFCGFLIKCSVQKREDCARRKCVTGTPTWMVRESKCLCMILPEQ